jgi:hypothetical protein
MGLRSNTKLAREGGIKYLENNKTGGGDDITSASKKLTSIFK